MSDWVWGRLRRAVGEVVRVHLRVQRGGTWLERTLKEWAIWLCTEVLGYSAAQSTYRCERSKYSVLYLLGHAPMLYLHIPGDQTRLLSCVCHVWAGLVSSTTPPDGCASAGVLVRLGVMRSPGTRARYPTLFERPPAAHTHTPTQHLGEHMYSQSSNA